MPKLIAELEEVKWDLQASLWALRDAIGHLDRRTDIDIDRLKCRRQLDVLNSKLDARSRATDKMEANRG